MNLRNVVKSAMGLSVAMALAACGGGNNNPDFSRLIPENDAVSINVPGDGDGQALLGARSDFYETTYNISRGVNGFVVGILKAVRDVSSNQPTKVEGNTYTWGPYEPQGLERLAWRLVATKIEDGHWKFEVDGRQKGSTSEDDFKKVVDGDVTAGAENANRGHGTMNLFFDAAQALEQKSCGNGNRDVLEGTAAVTFAADTEPKTLNVEFTDFRNACDGEHVTRQPAKYVYSEATDGAGNFQFSAHGNVHKATENKPLIEKMTMRSRWMGNGAGRSDVTIGEGEVPADMAAHSISGDAVIATECWDEMFNVTYQTTEPTDLPEDLRNAIRPTEGVATDCVYAEAELPDDI